MTPLIGKVLCGFQHRVARSLMGCQPRQGRDAVWVYPPLEDAVAAEGLKELDTYVYHHHNTVAQFIENRPNMDLCLAASRKKGHRYPYGGGNRTGWMWRGLGRRL